MCRMSRAPRLYTAQLKQTKTNLCKNPFEPSGKTYEQAAEIRLQAAHLKL